MKGKVSFKAGVVLIVFGMLTISLILAFAFNYSENIVNIFDNSRKLAGEKLYKIVNEYDFEDDYPQTPEELMDCYLNLSQMIYGGYFLTHDYIDDMLEKQRMLLSDEILEMNSFEKQLETLLDDLTFLEDGGGITRYLERQVTSYPVQDADFCIVPVKQLVMEYGEVYWNYHLSKDDDGKWKIDTWVEADHRYRPLVK